MVVVEAEVEVGSTVAHQPSQSPLQATVVPVAGEAAAAERLEVGEPTSRVDVTRVFCCGVQKKLYLYVLPIELIK